MSELINKLDATTIPVMPKEYRKYQTMNLDDAYEQGWNDLQRCIDELPSAEPKPCPFCGWGTIVDGGFLNHKCTCNSCGASTKGYATWELAVEAWNRRAGEQE